MQVWSRCHGALFARDRICLGGAISSGGVEGVKGWRCEGLEVGGWGWGWGLNGWTVVFQLGFFVEVGEGQLMKLEVFGTPKSKELRIDSLSSNS